MLEVIDNRCCRESHPTPMLFVHGANRAACCWDEHFLDAGLDAVKTRNETAGNESY
jgi:hypothetical protein